MILSITIANKKTVLKSKSSITTKPTENNPPHTPFALNISNDINSSSF